MNNFGIPGQSCSNCRFFKSVECHRRAPFVFFERYPHHQYVSKYPRVSPNDWCGEWKELIIEQSPPAVINKDQKPSDEFPL